MMEQFRNMIRQEALRAMSLVSHSTVAYVSSFDPNTFTAKVMYDPSDPATETGWLPVGALTSGAGWGMYAAPMINDQVMVDFMEADSSSGVIRCGMRPDGGLKIPSGEIWMVHNSGSAIKLTTDGKIKITGTVEIDAGNPNVSFVSLVTEAFMALYNGHTHPYMNGVTPATTSPTTALMTSTELTAVLKGN